MVMIQSELSSPTTGSDSDTSSPSSIDSIEHITAPLIRQTSSTEGSVRLPSLSWDDIRVGRILGKGAFSKVKEVKMRGKKRESGSKQKYAVKFLRNSTMGRKDILPDAMADLAIEGQFLSCLNHENIVQIHAQGSLSDALKDDSRYFLLLDRLDITLDYLIGEWRLEDMPYFMRPDNFQKPPLMDRIQSIALPVARAMEYLHSANIVFRDLKPLNIGFQDGTVKLFDFGLARMIDEDVKLTGRVGSPLYMAPEVLLSQDYGLSADVFSYAVLLWELVTVNIPFDGFNKKELEKAVVEMDQRPGLDKSNCESQQLRDLISKAWARSPDARPTFSTICSLLEDAASMGDDAMMQQHRPSQQTHDASTKLSRARAA